MKFGCQSCQSEFENEGNLARHISAKKICREFYGKEKLEELRKKGRQKAVKKWKTANSGYYQDNKCNIGSILNAETIENESAPKKEKESRYSYVPNEVRNKTKQGKAFTAFFKLIFDRKRSEYFDNIKDSLRDKIYNATADYTLDSIFNELHCEEFPGVLPFKKWKKWGFDWEMDPSSDNFEKQFQKVYEKKLAKSYESNVEYTFNIIEIRITNNCYKPHETYAFCNFLGKFSKLLPDIEQKAIESEELEDFDAVDESFFNKATDFEDLQRIYFERRLARLEKINQELLSKLGTESEMGKTLERRIDEELSMFFDYVKKKPLSPVGFLFIPALEKRME